MRHYLDADVHIDSITVMLLTEYNRTKNGAIYDQRFIY